MAEDNLRRGLMITAGDPRPFFTRPISAVLFVMLIVSVIWSTAPGKWIGSRLAALWTRKKGAPGTT